MCPQGNGRLQGGRKTNKLIEGKRKNVDLSCPQSSAKSTSRLSTLSSMSESATDDLDYKRRKLNNDCGSHTKGKGREGSRRRDNFFSLVSRNARLVAPKEKGSSSRQMEAIETRPLSQTLDSRIAKGSIGSRGLVNKGPKGSLQRIIEVEIVNDSSSSSKSIIDQVLSSINVDLDETSECSSTRKEALKFTGEDLSEKEFCTSILKIHGLLRSDCLTKTSESPQNKAGDGRSYFRSCNICCYSETVNKLLICDNCEEAFHMYCCKPRLEQVPTDDWFCYSCVKKGCKTLKEKRTRNFSCGRKNISSKGKTSVYGLMIGKNEPYTTSVRIGKAFQANVPVWSGPIAIGKEFGEPLEIDESEYFKNQEYIPYKTYKQDAIVNWLQCQAVLDASEDDLQNGTICGKWRRAPLFDVQTDDWECFSSIHWDPERADCAVPQEVETVEVLRQLKQIEKLRPQLLAKWKNQGDTKSKVI